MKLIKFKIENFKKFKNVEFNFDKKLNILTGYNNSGKTTVLEALSLWNECYKKLIHKVNAKDSKLNIQKGQFRLGFAPSTWHSYFEYSDIVSIRTTGYHDIFYNLDSSYILLTAIFTNKDNESVEISFRLEKVSGMNYKIFLNNWRDFDYQYFNTFFENPLNPINTIFISPIASIFAKEQFQTNPVIKDKIIKMSSSEVMRNRIYNLDETQFSLLKKNLEYILFDNKQNIEFIRKGDKNKDIYIDYLVEIGNKDIFKNIALLGSGSIHIIEILLSLVENNNELNILLFDEPDAHIHRDMQKRLLDVLIKSFNNVQIFITTHNESLIRSSKPNYIFHLENTDTKIYFPISTQTVDGIRFGLQPTMQLKVLQSLGSETSLDLLNALESDYLFLVEGKSDSLYIQTILDKKYIDKKYSIMYWSFDGVENIFKHIETYKLFLSNIKNEVSLWDKSILIMDRDFFTPDQAFKLQKSFQSKLKITVFIWNFYTIESVLLSNKNKFARLLVKFLEKQKLNANIEDVLKIMDEKIKQIIDTKKSKIDNEILKWIKDRQKTIKDNGFDKNILPDQKAYSDIKDYILKELENENLSVVADKYDIDDILGAILNKYNIKIEKVNLFYEVLQCVDLETWYNEWDRLIEVIDG